MSRGEDHVVGVVTGGNPVVSITRRAGSEHEGSTSAEHHDGDQGVVEPSHLAVAVKALEVVAVPIEDRSDPGPPDAMAGFEVEAGVTGERMFVGPECSGESLLGDVAVVAEDLGRRPPDVVQEVFHLLGRVADEAVDQVDPRVVVQSGALDGCGPVDLEWSDVVHLDRIARPAVVVGRERLGRYRATLHLGT
jgi:hypothetical protein